MHRIVFHFIGGVLVGFWMLLMTSCNLLAQVDVFDADAVILMISSTVVEKDCRCCTVLYVLVCQCSDP